jgi:uncharacterized damage-inducible protein DinB
VDGSRRLPARRRWLVAVARPVWHDRGMTADAAVRLDILPIWRRLNGMLIELVDFVPDDRMRWSPQPELWSFERLFVHLAEAREQWLTRAFDDGEANTIASDDLPGKTAIRDALRRTWERVERTLTDQQKLDATYRDRWSAGAPPRTGHWVAFHLLEHDIHHRADILLYLALLGVDTRPPQIWTS